MRGRKRTRDHELPVRVYRRHGAFYYVSADGGWHHLVLNTLDRGNGLNSTRSTQQMAGR